MPSPVAAEITLCEFGLKQLPRAVGGALLSSKALILEPSAPVPGLQTDVYSLQPVSIAQWPFGRL